MANEQLIDDIVEHINDGIEELPPIIEEGAQILKTQRLGFFAVGVGLGVAAGFGLGYFLLNKQLETKYQKISNDEISEMREHYLKLKIALEGEAQRRRPLEELVVESGYTEVEQAAIDEANAKFPADPEPEVVQQNVFGGEEVVVEWDYEAEIAHRRPDVPYIIHLDEFKENQPDHDQLTYTYYEIDDALVDAQERTIDDMDEFIGLGNLGRWGHGSNDPNIVYIRNEHLSMDMEVVRDRGSFAQETGRHLRHSSDRRRRPQRGFDDD